MRHREPSRLAARCEQGELSDEPATGYREDLPRARACVRACVRARQSQL